jgi:UDP-N-acetylmuramoyl-L-alanine---L-glutamate ligase
MYLERLLSLPESQKIAVIGLGQENLQFIHWLLNVVNFNADQILLADKNTVDTSSETLSKFVSYPKNIYCGDNYLDVLDEESLTLVFKTPGIWSLMPKFVDFRKKHGDDSIISSLVFFYEKYRQQIIAVTGTKGKSTTASLLNHLLSTSNTITSHYCGNTTNISPYQFWTDLNQEIDPNKYFVIETSSFQLQDIALTQISSKYGIITNYYIDHQDQHGGPKEYWEAKDSIFKFQTNDDITLITKSVKINSQTKDKLTNTRLITTDFAHEIANLFQSSLKGSHNESNISQAIITYLKIINKNLILTDNLQILNQAYKEKQYIQKALDSYIPLPHRQEIFNSFVKPIVIKTQKNEKILNLNVRFIDDGAATEPDAVVAAIKTLTSKPNQYIWLFVAGKDKGGDLENLSKSILDAQLINRLYKIYYCGQMGQNLLSHIYLSLGIKNESEIESFKQTLQTEIISKEKIVNDFQRWLNDHILQLEELGDQSSIKEILAIDIELNIALSPCGASFDEFTSYKERCLWFQDQIKQIL